MRLMRGTVHRIPSGPPTRRALKSAEDRLQEACVAWARTQMPSLLIFAIPNGGARSKAQGGILKATGVKPGAPDLCAVLPGGRCLWLEVKTPEGRLSPDQRKFHAALAERGHTVVTVYGFDEFRQVFVRAGIWTPRGADGKRGDPP